MGKIIKKKGYCIGCSNLNFCSKTGNVVSDPTTKEACVFFRDIDKVYVEDAVEQSIRGLEWMIDYCNEKLDNPKFTHLFECPGGCDNKWVHGGDDSTFDYIPNGIDTIVWIAQVMSLLWNHEINDYRELVMEKDIFRRTNDIPPIQDCVPEELRKKIIVLAYRLGYTVHDMDNAGLDEVIHEFDFKKIKEDLVNDPEEYQDEDGYYYKSKYLGSVMNISPSGKYYTPIANSNVTEDEAIIDQIFWEKLEEDAGKEGILIQNGEGNPTDVFAVWYFGNKPDEETENEPDDEGESVRCSFCGHQFTNDDDMYDLQIGSMEHTVCGDCLERWNP